MPAPHNLEVSTCYPVFKKGDVKSYRPVSVLPVVVKVFKELVHRQLFDYLWENNIIHPHNLYSDLVIPLRMC